MKLYRYWMDNDYSIHHDERGLPDSGDNRVDYEDASYVLGCKLRNGEIKDFRVELRKD